MKVIVHGVVPVLDKIAVVDGLKHVIAIVAVKVVMHQAEVVMGYSDGTCSAENARRRIAGIFSSAVVVRATCEQQKRNGRRDEANLAGHLFKSLCAGHIILLWLVILA